MHQIRAFNNADLPALVSVWSQHWGAAGTPPLVSPAVIEQALLAKSFFDPRHLLVAESDEQVVAWCHFFPAVRQPERAVATGFFGGQRLPVATTLGGGNSGSAILGAICFDTNRGIEVCDDLMQSAERLMAESGFNEVIAGPLRESTYGYAGLAPIGHGIGVPAHDTRSSSLLSRLGFSKAATADSMTASCAQYRPPVSREAMQLRRSTRVQSDHVLLPTPETADALAHLDIERHELVEHRTGTVRAYLDLWLSDPQAQVMDCSEAILSLRPEMEREGLTTEDRFLAATIIQSLANRRVFTVEAVVDSTSEQLQENLRQLGFARRWQGHCWRKAL